MNEADEDYSSRVGTKVPAFYGDKAKWTFYKKKLESYRTRSGLSELFKKTVGDVVEKDDFVHPSGATDEAKEEMKQIQRMNQKAADILLNSILTDTEKGQSVFYLT